MATKNPRVSVMLKPSSNAILDRLCAVSGQSKSGLIAEFLEDTCMPMFERMVVVLEAASIATDEAKAAARQGFQEAEDKLMEVANLTSDMFDVAARPVLQEAERIRRRGVRVGRAAARAGDAAPEALPPHVTRGSGTPNRHLKEDIVTMKTGSKVVARAGSLGTNAKYSAAAAEKSPPKRVKRPAKALNPKVGG
jgi:hypothetical protein